MTDSTRESILPKEINGVVFVMGLRGVGKSLFALQADLPSRILFLDYEAKGRAWDEQLHFGRYVDVPAEAALAAKGKPYKGRDMWKFTQDLVNGLEDDRYTTCVIDTVGDFEATLADEIRYQPSLYGVKETQQGGGFGGIYPALSLQVSNFISRLNAKGIRLVIAVAHVKPAWTASGPVPNKLRPHGTNEWHDRSILEVALIPGTGTIPAALVQKEQLARVSIDSTTGLFTIQRSLPLRLPEATWAGIRNYLESPADLTNPKEGETPTDEERGPYSEFFSQAQMEFLIRSAEQKASSTIEEA